MNVCMMNAPNCDPVRHQDEDIEDTAIMLLYSEDILIVQPLQVEFADITENMDALTSRIGRQVTFARRSRCTFNTIGYGIDL